MGRTMGGWRAVAKTLGGITRGFAALVCAALIGASGARAAGSDDPDWPCIQRKVPEISSGMVWAGPSAEGLAQAWRADSQISQLARRIAARRTPLDDAKQAIADFAGNQGADKDRKLTLLFVATLSVINGERSSLVNGIKRYARRQAVLADKIQKRIAELNALNADGDEAQAERRRALEEAQVWDTRIYEERERSLTYICEQPVVLEQRVFALAREIMAHLD